MSNFKKVLQQPFALICLLGLSEIWIAPMYRIAHGISRDFDLLRMKLSAPIWLFLLITNLWLLSTNGQE